MQQYDHNTADTTPCGPDCNRKKIYWSIVRPTCRALEQNPLFGPLLVDPEQHAQYIEYVRSFVDTVVGNSSFIDQLQMQLAAIKDDVEQDFWYLDGFWGPGGDFSAELEPDASKWDLPSFPWLPFLVARADEIKLQLEAYDAGTFPRGPHLPEAVFDSETCVDWRSTEPPCPQNCEYDGCLQKGWMVGASCNATTGTCYHGDFDFRCADVPDGERYPGMEDRNGSATFCFGVWFGPVKMSECPPLLIVSESDVGGIETDTGESVSKEATENSNEKNDPAENTENISAGSGQLSFVLSWWLCGTILLPLTAW